MKKIEALALHLGCETDDINYDSGDRYEIIGGKHEGEEYWVLTESEADTAWDESLDSYIDDYILPECKDDTLARYFDRDAWKRDARHNGRGHSLSSYDGEEHEVRDVWNDTWIFIYRVG